MVGVGMIYNIYSIISTLSFDSKKKSFHRPILEHARNEPQCAVWHFVSVLRPHSKFHSIKMTHTEAHSELI